MQWYDTFYTKDPALLPDINNKVLGIARLRQHRVERKSCPIPQYADELNLTCLADFTASDESREEFQEYWKPKVVQVEYNRLIDFWKYGVVGDSTPG